MLGINLDTNFLIIIVICFYGLYLIISNKFVNLNKNIEGFKDSDEPSGFDLYDKNYKPVLKQKTNETCIVNNKTECLPYSVNYQPSGEKQFKEPNSNISNLLGQNFLNAKHHSQVDNVGIYPRNKKVDIRPELINPQLGVDPWTQSIINIDYKKDNKVLQNPILNKSIYN